MDENEARYRRTTALFLQTFIEIGLLDGTHFFDILNEEAEKQGYTISCDKEDAHLHFTKMHKA